MALASIGKNYAGNDAKLEADIAAPWYKLWHAKFREDIPTSLSLLSRLMVSHAPPPAYILAAGVWTFRSGILLPLRFES